jgi:hypothetical protein
MIDGDYATVIDCSLDQAEIYNLDGEVVVSSSDELVLRETLLVHEAGDWKVTDFQSEGEPCET